MSKFIYIGLLSVSLLTVSNAFADEVTKNSTIETDGANYRASSSTTTREQSPDTVTRESNTVQETTPNSQEITTKKTYRTVPRTRQKTTTINKETNVVQ